MSESVQKVQEEIGSVAIMGSLKIRSELYRDISLLEGERGTSDEGYFCFFDGDGRFLGKLLHRAGLGDETSTNFGDEHVVASIFHPTVSIALFANDLVEDSHMSWNGKRVLRAKGELLKIVAGNPAL